ncbi:alpha/beta hydrolase, partial [Streptomyces sp. NPDC058914]
MPGTDAVIPPEVTEVTEAVQDAPAGRARFARPELPEAGHRSGLWFRDRAEDRRAFVTAVPAPA